MIFFKERVVPFRLLDVGVGNGSFSALFVDKMEVHGIDISDMIEEAKMKGINAVKADVEEVWQLF